MKLHRRWSVFAISALLAFFAASAASHADVLVADRPQDRVLKYSDNGAFLNVVVQDVANLGGPGNAHGPGSLALSPDGTKLYLGSLNNKVVRYDFNGTTASNSQVYVSNGLSTIADPGGVLVAPGGSTVYVANRGFGFSDAVAPTSAAAASPVAPAWPTTLAASCWPASSAATSWAAGLAGAWFATTAAPRRSSPWSRIPPPSPAWPACWFTAMTST